MATKPEAPEPELAGRRSTASVANDNPKRGFLFRWLKKRRHTINDFVAKSSIIPDVPVFDPEDFDWASEIAEHWEEIRDEALAIYRHRDAIPPLREISPDHRRIIQDDSWRSFFLIGYGNEVPGNIARAPRTAELVRRIPNLNSAFFSILAPGAHITRHRGPAKSMFTAHLGLSVPSDWQNCKMQVDDEYVHWRDGEWTIFDDTYHHEVWNRTDEPRIILLCQVGRPLRAPGKWIADFFMAYLRRSAFVTEAKRELANWEETYQEAERSNRR